MLWDTWVHEKAQTLGHHHKRYKLSPSADETEEVRVKEEVEELDRVGNSLVATCHRHGVPYAMEGQKPRLQTSFLTHPPDTPFTEEQICYSAEDALAAAHPVPTPGHASDGQGNPSPPGNRRNAVGDH